MNFLFSLISGQPDDRVHSVMVRYGRGLYEGPAANASVSGKKIKVSGSYLYVPILAKLLADQCEHDLSVQGMIISKTELTEEIEDHGLEILEVKKRGGFKYKVAGNLLPSEFKALYEDLWEAAVLTKAKAKGVAFSPAAKIPKPNKFSDASFCKLTMPSSEETQLATFKAIVPGIEASRFDDISVTHKLQIDEVIVPQGLSGKSASVLRLLAKRKGTLSRNLVIDGKSTEADFKFLA